MFAPLILSVLLPLNPALFLRELVQWFIGVLARTLQDQGFRDWLKENPKDRNGLPDLLGSLLMIEDMISALVHIRARQILGHRHRHHRHRRKGKGRRPRYGPWGHPRSLLEIELRFQRALARLADVERLAARRAARIKRLLDQAATQLETVHHPVEPSTTTILRAPDPAIPSAPTPATTILHARNATTAIPRAPP
jgi:hypothetical protein